MQSYMPGAERIREFRLPAGRISDGKPTRGNRGLWNSVLRTVNVRRGVEREGVIKCITVRDLVFRGFGRGERMH